MGLSRFLHSTHQQNIGIWVNKSINEHSYMNKWINKNLKLTYFPIISLMGALMENLRDFLEMQKYVVYYTCFIKFDSALKDSRIIGVASVDEDYL